MKPAWLGKVPPDFTADGGKMAEIRAAHKENPEIDRRYQVELRDSHGTAHTVIERTVYIADKRHHSQKTSKGEAR
jgi:hypothetical protein